MATGKVSEIYYAKKRDIERTCLKMNYAINFMKFTNKTLKFKN